MDLQKNLVFETIFIAGSDIEVTELHTSIPFIHSYKQYSFKYLINTMIFK